MPIEISVILPFFNTPHLMLRKAINHLLEQSFDNFELILIDDGSENDYSYLIEEYHKDGRVKYIKQPNNGVSSARNRGIELSNGKYIVFHDADDFVENNYLYSLHNEIKNSDLVICGIAAQWYPVVDSYIDIREFLSTPSTYNHVQYTNFSVNKIFKKNILTENSIKFDTNIKLGEDALFIAEYLKHCKLIRTIPQQLYHYIPHNSSATNKYDKKYWEYENKVISSQLKLFSSFPLNNKEEFFMENWTYIKLRGCLFYYLWWEKDIEHKEKIISEIRNSQFFINLTDTSRIREDNPYFSKVDKIIITLWRKFNSIGIKTSYQMKIVKSKIERIRNHLKF